MMHILKKVQRRLDGDEGFTLVIERSTGGIAFASESIDVTTAIVDSNDNNNPGPNVMAS